MSFVGSEWDWSAGRTSLLESPQHIYHLLTVRLDLPTYISRSLPRRKRRYASGDLLLHTILYNHTRVHITGNHEEKDRSLNILTVLYLMNTNTKQKKKQV